MSRAAALRALRAAQAYKAAGDLDPLRYSRRTLAQAAFMRNTTKYKVLRTGNGFGKTRACSEDVWYRARGHHPYREVRKPPVEQLVTCISWSQAVPIMKTFHEIMDYRLVKKCREFREKDGFGKDGPVIELHNGSTIRFGTMDQGPRRHAGARYDHILIDEPPGLGHYRELERRVFRTEGDLTIGLTPVNAPEPMDWLEDLCERGVLDDMHFRLDLSVTTFEDGTVRRLPEGTPMDEAWIAKQRADAIGMWAPVILDGEWRMASDGAFFNRFNTADHVTDEPINWRNAKVCFGVDYGSGRDRSQFAVLVAYRVHPITGHPQVWVLAEDGTQGDTVPAMDARRYIRMLQRFGMRWQDLHEAHGDKPYLGRRGRVYAKSNDELAYALAAELKLERGPEDLQPALRQVKRGRGAGRGSIDWGCTWLHRAMLRPGHFRVDASCVQLIESLQRWDFTDNEYKHPIDALRYSVWTPSMANRNSQRATTYIYTG